MDMEKPQGLIGANLTMQEPAPLASEAPGAEEATPEEQQAFELAVTQALELIYRKDIRAALLKGARASGDPAMAASDQVFDAIVLIDEKHDLPETVILRAAINVLAYVIELLNAAKVVSDEEGTSVWRRAGAMLAKKLMEHYGETDEDAALALAEVSGMQMPGAEAPAGPSATPAAQGGGYG